MYKINQITILGSGIMGHGIAQISSMAGYNVVLRDIEQSFLDKAMDKIKWSVNKLVEKQKVNNEEAQQIINRIHPIVDLEQALKNTDMVIEAVPEDLNLKKKVYQEIEKFATDDMIFASNTSTLPISEISSFTTRPDKFIGLHFFNPPQLMPLVEIIPGSKTSKEITDLAINFVQKVKKTPIVCRKDVVGFIVNRIFIPLVHEAAYCLDRSDASMVEVDSASKYKMALPMGIFELADYTGLDVIHKATFEMYSRDKKVIFPHPKIQQLYENKELGQKTGKGFYPYQGENYERVQLTEEAAGKFDPIPLVSVAVNNASWLISNDVCNIEELEQALKLGMGLKRELFNTAETIGIKNIINTLKDLQSKYGMFYEPDKYLLSLQK
ncbi:MAG TPA: 3-hydroxyacyl-CoA dehydrogenase family protein [Nitrososphaeraceae archaeon]|nr:3-hydroxyacyl-CoA dehydrogenase family protein [Nitrososphaeraceae archaeon]